MPQKDLAPPQSTAPFRGCFLKGCVTILALMVVAGLALFWFYGVDSHHENLDSIWPLRGRNLIPPAATDITLRRDVLDHMVHMDHAERCGLEVLVENHAERARGAWPGHPGIGLVRESS